MIHPAIDQSAKSLVWRIDDRLLVHIEGGVDQHWQAGSLWNRLRTREYSGLSLSRTICDRTIHMHCGSNSFARQGARTAHVIVMNRAA
jgi:hypothetical protein